MLRVRLTPAQVAALQQRDVALDPVTVRAWRGNVLAFSAAERDELWRELTDAANAEDGQAESDTDPVARRYARAACRALTGLASKILTAC